MLEERGGALPRCGSRYGVLSRPKFRLYALKHEVPGSALATAYAYGMREHASPGSLSAVDCAAVGESGVQISGDYIRVGCTSYWSCGVPLFLDATEVEEFPFLPSRGLITSV